jgi:carbon storage regulator
MLVLSRHKGEKLMIGDDVTVVVVEIRGDKVRLGIEAPTNTPVHRREVYDAIHKQKQVPLKSGVPSEKWEPKEGEEFCELTLHDDFPKGSIVKWGYDSESFWYRTEEDLPKGSRLAFPAACAGRGHCSIIHDERLTGEE